MKQKKKNTEDGILFCGQASEEVTGSMYYVNACNHKILLESGLHQSSTNSYLDAYKVNSRKFPFDPSEIEYIFICHSHIDHSGILPRLVKEGFRGKIIMTSKTKEIVSSLLLNSQAIIKQEAKFLNKRYKGSYKPIYDEDHVHHTMKLVKTYDEYDEMIDLGGGVSFKWFRNSHCVGATQLLLCLTDDKKTRRILYTSDLGDFETNNHYVDKTEIPKDFANVTLMESTYADPKRVTKKTRDFDMEHLKIAIETTIARGGSVIMPAFSFSRTQELLTCLYELFGQEEDFPLVYVDSPLSVEITRKYENVLDDKDIKNWKEILKWSKLRTVINPKISETIVQSRTPKIVISSSGFCTNGRIVNYLSKYLRDSRNLIIFSGYVGNNPSYLSYRIKNFKTSKTIKINGVQIPNRANCMTLYTYSSHMGHKGLVKFGSSLNTNKLYLVHGEKEGQMKLKPILQEAIFNNDRTYQVEVAGLNLFVPL